MTAVWDDPRVARGTELMLELRRRRLASGERPVGCKAPLGARPAIEIADVEPDLLDAEQILAGDIYQRHVILRPADRAGAGADSRGVTARVMVDGEERDATDDPTAFCGDLAGIVQHTAALLAAAGERLRAGDVIIAGSVVPLVWPEPGQQVTVEMPPLGALSVRFARRGDAS